MARASRALRRGVLRVDDPLGNGMRVNRPGGWLTDPTYWVNVGPLRPDRTSPFAWDGSDSGYGWVGPGSWSGLPASWAGGDVASIVVPAVERCTGVIVNAVIRTDWQMLRSDDTGEQRRPLPLWVTDPMLLGSVPGALVSNTPAMNRLSATDFWSTLLTHAMWYGRGVFVGVEAADGGLVPGTLRLINPYLLTWDPNRGWLLGDPTRPVEVPFDGRFTVGDTTFRLVVLRGLGPNDGNLPEGILARHWDALQVAVDIRTYLSESYLTGNQPSGFLKVSDPAFNAAKAAALKDSWTTAHGGSSRSVAVLNSTVDYTPIALSKVVDSAANEITHISRGDVALMFNLDPVWVGEGACVDEQTTAYTRDRGWVEYQDLHEGDEVLALDHDAGLASWSRVTAMNVYDVVDSPVVEYASAYHSSVTTLGHRWPVLAGGVREWTTTGDGFDKSHSIVLGAPLVELPSDAKYSDAFVELVAWFYTEGHWVSTARNVAYISQSHTANPSECARIRASLTALFGPENAQGRNGHGATWYEQRAVGGNNEGMSVFRLSRESSAPLLDLLGPGKVVPFDFIDSLTRAQLELFLHVSVLADGHHGKSGDRALLQNKPAMFAGFQRAALLLGIPAPVTTWQEPGRTDPRHRISLPTRTTLKMRGQKVSVRLHTGVVWCPTTEHGTWLASRNGKPFFTGNSGLTYNNASDRRRDLVDLTASAWGQKLMDVLSSLLPYGTGLRINWESFTTPLTTTGAPTAAAEPTTDPAPSDPAG